MAHTITVYSVGQRDQTWYNVRRDNTAWEGQEVWVIGESSWRLPTMPRQEISGYFQLSYSHCYVQPIAQTHQFYIQNCPSVLFFIVLLLLPYSPFFHHLASSL